MNVGEIIKDSLKYPLSDWNKFLILGVMLVITDMIYLSKNFGVNNIDLLVLLIGITFIIGFLVNGYIFKIIKSSFEGKVELPEFKNLVDMGTEGAKVYIVYIVYLIPTILLIIYLILSSYEALLSFINYVGISIFDYLIPAFNSVLWQGIDSFLGYLITLFQIAFFGLLYALIGILYMIFVIPILLVAIANMVYYEGDLKSAFEIREIIEEISLIGWRNVIKWYILTLILFVIFIIIINIIYYIFDLINPILGEIIVALILYPYISIFLARSVALLYMPEEDQDIKEEESISQGKFIKDYQ